MGPVKSQPAWRCAWNLPSKVLSIDVTQVEVSTTAFYLSIKVMVLKQKYKREKVLKQKAHIFFDTFYVPW